MARHRARHGLLPAAAALTALLGATSAMGHASFITADETRAVQVEARFDTGAPMAGAQVTVFAPADPMTPSIRGVTDADGRYLFVPQDGAGRWTVQVRQAGHGATVHIDLGAAAAPAVLASAATSPGQRFLMSAAVVWGCIGTALYFRRERAG